MPYDYNIMPQTIDEWNKLIDHYFQLAQQKYDEEIAKAESEANETYANLPESPEKPSINEYIATYIQSITQPPSRQDIEDHFSIYFPQDADPAPNLDITPEMLFNQLRSYREVKFQEYDAKIAQLNRLIRENPENDAYIILRKKWDEYAKELCNLTEQDGAPWDGGGSETPWPKAPE